MSLRLQSVRRTLAAAALALTTLLAPPGDAGWTAAGERIDGGLEPVVAGSPRVARNASGAFIVAWIYTSGTDSHVAARRYDGSSWRPAVRLDTAGSSPVEEVDVAIGTDGVPTVVWVENSSLVGRQVWTAYHPATGWSTPERLDDPTTGDAAGVSVGAGPDGKAVAGWTETFPIGTHYIARFRDGGSWSTAISPGIGEAYPDKRAVGRVAMDATGHAVAAWSMHDGTGYRMHSAAWDGTQWQGPIPLDAAAVFESWAPWVAMDESGDAAVTWIHNPGGTWRQRAAILHEGEWLIILDVDTAPESGLFGDCVTPRIALGPGGTALATCTKAPGTAGWHISMNLATNRVFGNATGIDIDHESTNAVPAVDATGVGHVVFQGPGGARAAWIRPGLVQGPIDIDDAAPADTDSAWVYAATEGPGQYVYRRGTGLCARSFTADNVTGNPPELRSVRPASGAAGARIEIRGKNFGKARGTVRIGGVPAVVKSWKTTAVVAEVPEGAGSVEVDLVTAAGIASVHSDLRFTYSGPVLSRISPKRTAAGHRAVLHGTNFGAAAAGGGCSIDFGGTRLDPGTPAVVKWTNRSIKVVVPAGAGAVPVTVTTAVGTSAPRTFTYK